MVVVVVDADEDDVGVIEYIDTDISRGMVEVGCRFERTKVNHRPSYSKRSIQKGQKEAQLAMPCFPLLCSIIT